MRYKFFLSVLLLVAGAGLLWSQFYRDFSDKDRKTLGESYWLAGKQYEAVNKAEKGREFQALARLIYPSLDPAAIKDEALPTAAELLAQGRAIVIRPAAEVPAQSLNSFFLRFAGALLDGDSAEVAGFLDGSVYLSGIPVEVNRAEAQAQLDAFFDEVSLAGLTPSSVYALDSLVVARAPQAMQDAWGETYTLRVDSKVDYSRYVSFWERKQQFFIRKTGGNLFIVGIGQNPPPLSWRPQKIGAPPVARATVSSMAETSKAVVDAFTASMSALLAKNSDGALSFMTGNIRFLRLRQTVTKEELKTTLLGYFESTDFGSATVTDVLDTGSIFVEQAESPVEGVQGPVYLLNVMAKADLSESIPFWSTHQKYYFTQEGGDWKIFAIL